MVCSNVNCIGFCNEKEQKSSLSYLILFWNNYVRSNLQWEIQMIQGYIFKWVIFLVRLRSTQVVVILGMMRLIKMLITLLSLNYENWRPIWTLVFVQMGSISMRAQVRGIGGRFQIIYAFIWICWNFFIRSKIRLFGGKIWVKYDLIWSSYFTNFPLAKFIYIWILLLNCLQNQGFLKTF